MAIGFNVGVLRVITRPEFDPTRSKETKYLTRTRPEIFKKQFDPTRPEPGIFKIDPEKSTAECKKFPNALF